MAQRITKAQDFTANSQNMDLDITDVGYVAFSLRGTYALTVSFFVSDDGTNFYPLLMTPSNSATPVLSHNTANASVLFGADVAPYTKFRVSTTAYTSGTGSGRMTATPLVH